MAAFREIANDVHVLRYPVLDVNCTLIVGDRTALLVDTLSCPSQARELAAGVRGITDLPVTVANTHFHFDHTFGNSTIAEILGARAFWAHDTVIDTMRDEAAHLASRAYRTCLELAPAIAEEVYTTPLHVPNRPVTTTADIDLGGRTVRLWHPGPAHSPGDLVVIADEVFVAGDLIEEGAPPSIEGSDLANWPDVIDTLLPYMTGLVVPGHGDIVDAEFARDQGRFLARLSAEGQTVAEA